MDAELQKKLENPKMIIYDLETTSVDPRTAEIKFFSYMDLSTGDIRVLKWDNDVKIFVQKLIKNSTFVIGFNNENYDDLILLNHGIDLKYTRLIDIYQIFKARKAVIFKSEPSSLSMKNLIKILDLDNEGKGDIDYKIFQKSEWTQEEISEIVKYAKQDIILTKKLWDFLVQKFEPFKEFVSKENQLRFRYLKSTMGAYAYMVICNHLGIPEVYGSDGGHDEYIGAFVLEPQKEVVKGKILYFDFASLYPNMYVHANLFSSNCSCCTREERWHGNEMFKVEGYYCQKTQGKIEELIKHMFLKRKELKKAGDERQQVYKTCLNCFSEDTEIITESGIKLIKDCKVGDQVYSVNKTTGLTELKKINEILTKPYSGDMYNFSDQNKDLMVTPDHHMLFRGPLKHGISDKIQEINAKDVYQRTGMYPKTFPISGDSGKFIDMSKFSTPNCIFNIKLKNPYIDRRLDRNLVYTGGLAIHRSTIGVNNKLDGEWFIQGQQRDMQVKRFLPLKDLMYFIGIVLSEGNLRVTKEKYYENGNHRGVSYQTLIVQHRKVNPDIWAKIKKTLDNLGFRYSESNMRFTISSKFIYDFLSTMKKSSFDIHIPDWIFKLDHTLLKYLHDGLYDGDGNKNQYRYSTVSKQLRDDMMKLNLHLGFRTRYSKEDYITKVNKKKRTIWRVARTTIGWYKEFGKYGGKIIQNPTKNVVCLNVADNHTVMAGRNGKFVWTGQSMYGISSKPSFQQLYRPFLASDCTSLGQQCIRFAMKTFTDNGFEILYGDTDSILVQVPEYKTESEALTLSKEISKTISSNFPFPWAEFDFKLEDKLKYLQFFKAKDADNFKKKNYIYLTEDGKMIIKGLDIIQKDCSQVSKIIFEKIIKPMILEKQECKLNKKDVDYAIKEIIANDFSLLGKHFNIRETEDYKSDTSIYAMIKEKYGTGEMTLIKNHRIGAGKGVKYCNIDEAQDLKFQDLDMDDVYSELSPFIIVEKENKTLDMFI